MTDDNKKQHSEVDIELLNAIRRRQSDAWAQLIQQYQGRLVNFAMARLKQRADAEDVVQDTFVSFIRGLDSFRGQASLETYLFTILRNKIIDRYRSKHARSVSLIQDVFSSAQDTENTNPANAIPDPGPSASWCLSTNEQHEITRRTLTEALAKLLKGFKYSLEFQNLKIIELLFYCRISSADIARLLDTEATAIRVFKHRSLKQIKKQLATNKISLDQPSVDFENLLTEIWESNRLSCPKRSTVGSFLLGKLEPEWFDYVDFHITFVGCHFCRANLKDLKNNRTTDRETIFKKQIMASTVGFLSTS